MHKIQLFGLNSQRLPVLVGIFRVLPLNWIYSLKEGVEGEEKAKAQKQLFNLVSNGAKVLENYQIKQAHGDKYLFLTARGYEKINQVLKLPYKFRYWRKNATRISDLHRSHKYLMFVFMLNFLQVFPEKLISEVFLSYDKKCKLFFGKSYVDPDILIQLTGEKEDNNYIAVEADKGTEEGKILYDKILKYLIYGKTGADGKNINILRVYFTFLTQGRLDFIFNPNKQNKKRKSTLLDYFEPICSFATIKSQESLELEKVLQLLDSNKIEIYAGLAVEPFSTYKKVDLAGLIRERQNRKQAETNTADFENNSQEQKTETNTETDPFENLSREEEQAMYENFLFGKKD